MEMCSDAEVEEAEESSYILMDYTPLDTPSSAGSWGQCPALRHAPDTEPALVSSSLPNHACTSAPSIQVTIRLTTPDPQTHIHVSSCHLRRHSVPECCVTDHLLWNYLQPSNPGPSALIDLELDTL